MGHEHQAEHFTLFPSGNRIEICECGATRDVQRGVPSGWHACELCTHDYGRNDPEFPDSSQTMAGWVR